MSYDQCAYCGEMAFEKDSQRNFICPDCKIKKASVFKAYKSGELKIVNGHAVQVPSKNQAKALRKKRRKK